MYFVMEQAKICLVSYKESMLEFIEAFYDTVQIILTYSSSCIDVDT
jgi:hypothetical protein